jgi:hypothetical protein
MERVIEVAKGLNGSGFITTEKDAVKLTEAMRAATGRAWAVDGGRAGGRVCRPFGGAAGAGSEAGAAEAKS